MSAKSYEIQKPIFIIGVPRSGTTMLLRIMSKHTELAWFSHEDLKFLIPSKEQEELKKKFLKMKANNEKIPRNEGSLLVFGLEQGRPLEGTSKIPIEAESFWARYIQSYQSEISSDKSLELRNTLNKVMSSQKKNRFLNKAPTNSVRIFSIKKIFSDAKFINIARDPRPVIASMLTRTQNEGKFSIDWAFKDKKTKFEKSQKNNELIQYYAQGYKEITDYIYEFSKEKQIDFTTVIYESFLSNPEENLKKILNFCELDKPYSLSQMMPPKFQNTSEKWKKQLSEDDQKKIFEIVQESITKMDYPFKL